MTAHVWRGRWVDKRTGEPMELPPRNGLAAPMVQSDLQEYTSPIDGKPITSRSWQREDLKKNDCVLKEARTSFHPEEYKWRKAQQAKQLEKMRAQKSG